MKTIVRRPISNETRKHLTTRQSQVDAESDPEVQAKKADALWDSKAHSQAGKKAFVEIGRALAEMCNSPRRCMYCEDSEAWDIDHVKPKSKYPEVAFDWDNYLLACSICNSRFKGSQYITRVFSIRRLRASIFGSDGDSMPQRDTICLYARTTKGLTRLLRSWVSIIAGRILRYDADVISAI